MADDDGPSAADTPTHLHRGLSTFGDDVASAHLDSTLRSAPGPEPLPLGHPGHRGAQLATLAGFGLDRAEWHDNVRSLFEAFTCVMPSTKAKSLGRQSPTMRSCSTTSTFCTLSHRSCTCPRPRDVIDAWRRFYGFKSVRRSAHAWSAMSAQRTNSAPHILRQGLGASLRDLGARPGADPPQLLSWLGESWDEGVLDFADRPHSYGAKPLRLEDERWSERNGGAHDIIGVGTGLRPRCLSPLFDVRGATCLKFGYGRKGAAPEQRLSLDRFPLVPIPTYVVQPIGITTRPCRAKPTAGR